MGTELEDVRFGVPTGKLEGASAPRGLPRGFQPSLASRSHGNSQPSSPQPWCPELSSWRSASHLRKVLSGNQSALDKMQSTWFKFIFAQNILRILHTKKLGGRVREN